MRKIKIMNTRISAVRNLQLTLGKLQLPAYNRRPAGATHYRNI